MIAGGCGTDGSYEASVVALANDVRASLRVAVDGDLELLLERHYSSEAFGWEHCPVLHAEASINGLPMEAVREGGWVPVSAGGGLFEGGGGFCESMLYRLLEPPASLLEGEGVLVEVRDEGGVLAVEVPFIGVPRLALDEAAALVPGERAEIAVLPVGDALDLSDVRAHYIGGYALKAPGHSTGGFSIDELSVVDGGFSFVVPDGLDDSHGELSLQRLRSVDPQDWPEHGWPLSIIACEGAGGCVARRKLDGPLALELSVSARGEPVTPDPLEDAAHFRTCWFTEDTQGEAELVWTGDVGCSLELSPDGELASVTYFAASPRTPRASLALAFGDVALEAGTRSPVEVTVSTKVDAWRHPSCSVRIERVWRDIPERYSTVVDGSGQCEGSAAPLGLTAGELAIAPFTFRTPVATAP